MSSIDSIGSTATVSQFDWSQYEDNLQGKDTSYSTAYVYEQESTTADSNQLDQDNDTANSIRSEQSDYSNSI